MDLQCSFVRDFGALGIFSMLEVEGFAFAFEATSSGLGLVRSSADGGPSYWSEALSRRADKCQSASHVIHSHAGGRFQQQGVP